MGITCCNKEGLTIEKDYKIRRNYKDTMFRMLFSDKEKLLSLYNAISGSAYTDPELLEIVTLDSALYISYKNDLSFVIDSSIHLYEHQSTFSANLPLRDLFYISYEYECLTTMHSVYGSKAIKIPTPHFVVFYNGPDVDWEYKKLKLSDSYTHKEETPDLELTVHMYNINYGKNSELMKKCDTLHEYSQYVQKVRMYANDIPIKEAVSLAIEDCIHEGVLSEFLIKHRAEAIHMSIFDRTLEEELQLLRQDERAYAREEGLEEGRTQGLEEGRAQGIKEGMRSAAYALILDYRDANFPDEWIAERLRKHFDFTDSEITEFFNTAV